MGCGRRGVGDAMGMDLYVRVIGKTKKREGEFLDCCC